MLVKEINPAYVYAVIADFIAVLIGLGLVALTNVQNDLILGFVASVITLVTGVAVPAAKVNDARITKAFYTEPKPDDIVRL